MDILTALLIGFAAATVATCFPGLLNMSAVSVSLRGGRSAGYRFSLGMTLTFVGQTALAVFFANFFTRHPRVTLLMREWAVAVFAALAVYFIVKGIRAKRANVPTREVDYGGPPLLKGAGLAMMNLLTIPFFFALCGWLLASGYLAGSGMARTGFTLGAGAGAMLCFGIYVRLADWMDRRAVFLTRNINFLMGGLLMVFAVVQGMRVFGAS